VAFSEYTNFKCFDTLTSFLLTTVIRAQGIYMQALMWVWKMADHELKKLVTERVTIKFWGGLLNRLEKA
jgi:hypothetical protein